MAVVTGLGFNITSRFDNSGVARANREINRLQRNLNSASTGINTFGGRMSGAISIVSTLGPALLPVTNVIGGMGAALLATGGAAVTAGGLWAVMAKYQITAINKLAKSHKGLSAEQRGYLREQNALTASFKRFAAATANDTFRPMIPVMHGAQVALRGLVPLFHSVSQEVQVLGNALGRWLAGAGFQRFVTMIQKYGVPALRLFINMGRNMAAVLGYAWRALLPLGLQVVQMLNRGSAALRGWAAGGGFTRWVASIRAQLPQVTAFTRALWSALRVLAQSMASMAPGALSLATAFLRMVGSMRPEQVRAFAGAMLLVRSPVAWMIINVPGLSGLLSRLIRAMPPAAIYAVAGAMLALRLEFVRMFIASRLVALFNALRGAWMLLNIAFSSTGIGLVITALAALGVGIYLLATKTRFFQTVWNAVWGAVRTVGLAVWHGLRAAFGAVVNFMRSKWVWLIAAIGPLGWLVLLATRWRQIWNAIKSAALAVWNALGRAWRAVWTGVRNFGLSIWRGMSSSASNIWRGMSRTAGSIFRGLGRTLSSVWRGTRSAFGSAWHGMQRTGSGIWRSMSRTASSVFRGTARTLASVWRGVRSVFGSIWKGIQRTGSNVWRSMARTASSVFRGMQRTSGNVWHSTGRVFGSTWKGIQRTGSNVWHSMSRTAGNVFRGMARTLRGIWHGIQSAARSSWNALKRIVASPVKFVINTVVGSLARTFNSIAKAVHLGMRVPVPHVGFAQGGHVRGPGGPTADKIPAMLSDNEYVMPAKSVRKFGVGFFDALRAGKNPMQTLKPGALEGIPSQAFAGGGDSGKGKGIAGFIGGAISGISGFMKDMWDKSKSLAENLMNTFGMWSKKFISGTLFKGVSALMGKVPGGGIVKDFARAGAKKLMDGAIDLLFKKNEESFGGGFSGSFKGSIPTGKRKAIIMAALKMAHVPPPGSLGQWLAGLNTLITRESAWNPNAYNGWDSNAKAGMASRGLAQVIPPTFNAYAPAAAKRLGIMNPVANVAAAIRYIVARYGNITRVQQANASLPPKGYAEGGLVANSFDKGGYLPTGWSMAFNGTGRPEPVGHDLVRKGDDTGGISFHGCTFVGGNQKHFEDLLVNAYKEAKRKRRIS